MYEQKEGKAIPSVVASLLSTLDGDDAERELIFQNTAGTAYTGGADTVRRPLVSPGPQH